MPITNACGTLGPAARASPRGTRAANRPPAGPSARRPGRGSRPSAHPHGAVQLQPRRYTARLGHCGTRLLSQRRAGGLHSRGPPGRSDPAVPGIPQAPQRPPPRAAGPAGTAQAPPPRDMPGPVLRRPPRGLRRRTSGLAARARRRGAQIRRRWGPGPRPRPYLAAVTVLPSLVRTAPSRCDPQ